MKADPSVSHWLRLSYIDYVYDLWEPDDYHIRLGVIGELMAGPLHCVGMLARAQLAADELALLGRFARDTYAKPFDCLRELVNEAWEDTECGNVLVCLAESNPGSLRFSAWEELPVRQRVIRWAQTSGGEGHVLSHLMTRITSRWYEWQRGPQPPKHPVTSQDWLDQAA